MNLHKITLPVMVCLIFHIFSTDILLSQQVEQFNLLDQDSSLPIQGASFKYADQTGASDKNGTIIFSLSEENQSMKISHINYGEWEISGTELKIILDKKVYYRKNTSQNIYPVTIIGLHSSSIPSEKISLNYEDRIAHDGTSILVQTPAINSIRKGGRYGYDPVFRGFKYDQLNIVMNGAQSATAACPNRMDPPTSQMAPNMMDRIEVLKGPHALRYGTGFGATINFVPTKLRFTSTPDIYGRISSGYENNGEVFKNEGQIGFSGKNYDLSVLSSWSTGDDYESGNNNQIPADFERGSFGFNLGLKTSSNQQLRLLTIYNVAHDADFPALPMDLRSDNTWLFNIRHDIAINKEHLKSWNTSVFGSFVDHKMDNLLKRIDPRPMNASTTANTYNYGARSEGQWLFSNSNMYSGFDLRIEGADGTRVRDFLMGPNTGKSATDNVWQDSKITKSGLFTEYQLNTSRYKFIISGRLEMLKAELQDPSPEFSETYSGTDKIQVYPNVSVGIARMINENMNLSLWLGHAQRGGSLTERFINYFPVGQDPYEMVGNPHINPEKNNQIDFAFNWNSDKTGFDFDVFVSFMNDAISSVIDPNLSPRLPNSPGVRRFTNISSAIKTGFEVNWIQVLGAGLQHQLGLAYTYAQNNELNEPLPEIAPLDFRYAIIGHYLKNKLSPEINFRHVLKQSRISTEFGETETPSFTTLDINLAYYISSMFNVNIGITNLLDENYYEHLSRSVRGTPTPIYAIGRNVHASFSVNF